MRFVAPKPEYSIVLLEEISKPDPYSDTRQIIEKKGFVAQFRPGDYTLAEREFVIGRFKFTGAPDVMAAGDGMPTETPFDPTTRIGTYDTDQVNWERAAKNSGYEPHELKEIVEQKLLDSVYHGSDYVVFEAPKLKPPFKNYDNLRSPKRIAELVQEVGCDVEDVLLYEEQTKNRPEVIEALEGLLRPEPAETVIQA